MTNARNPVTAVPSVDAAWLITANQLAALLGVSIRTLWRLRRTGKVPPPVRIGSCIRWRIEEVQAWLDAGCPSCVPLRRIR